MNTPIIDPSVLTEEQRKVISNRYNNRLQIISDYEQIGHASTNIIIEDLFEWLFGEEFFNKEKE